MIPEYLSPLANHLWQSTIITGMAALLALVLRRNSARVRYWVWFLAAMKFLIPFSLLIDVGHRFEWRTVPALTQAPIVAVTEISMPFDLVASAQVKAPLLPVVEKPERMPAVFWSVWLCGFLVSVSLWIRSWLRVRISVNHASVLQIALPGNDTGVRVVSSSHLFEPAVVGMLKPVLVLPEGIAGRMAAGQLNAILIHELCHVRRRDNLLSAIYMMAESVFWFYPLVRWIGKRLIDERESACDEEVLRLGNERLVYAEGILDVCRTYLESPVQCASGVTGSDLKKRIRAILTGHVSKLSFTKKGILTLVALWVVAMPLIIGMAPASHALRVQGKDITGTWQGKLPVPQAPNGELRVVFKISNAEGGSFKATLYTIDQPSLGYAASAVTIQGSNVKITIPGIGSSYEGKLDADAITLTGTWTIGGMPFPLTLAHVKDYAAWEIPKPPPVQKMMAADADPVFEVATIKPSDPSRRRLFSIGNGTEVTAVGTTVRDLIVFAYGVHAGQISAAPAWVESDKFDIRGKPEGGGRPNPIQFKTMLQKLLADRFQLAFHRDKKQLAVYALTVGKNGPKLTRSEAAIPIPNLIPRGPGHLPARNVTMEEFAGNLQSAYLDRPVLDQTGLYGRFDFQLQWTPDETLFTKTLDGTETQPDLFTAIQQQLGLKLESTNAQIDVLVIDKIEKPSEN